MKRNKLKILLILGISSTLALSLASCNLLKQGSSGTSDITTNVPTFTTSSSVSIPSSSNSTTSYPTDKTSITFNILEFNDVHGYIEQDSNNKRGLSNAAKIVNDIRNEDNLDNTILIANGDMFQGTALSRVSEGRVMIDAMNKMGFDACGIGNHEFDWYLSSITKYFDGNKDNGEADFPLLNANIYENASNELVGYDSDSICPSTIVEKEGVKIGIVSMIGNVYSSICYNMVKDYRFDTDFQTIAYNEGVKLKEKGADIIICNIHDGDSSGVENYLPNNQIANLKYNGQYLYDAMINGHTHTRQDGAITRSNGTQMPIIQSNGYRSNYMYTFGRIDLTYNLNTKKVTTTKTSFKYIEDEKGYDQDVENVLDSYYDASKDILTEVYCQTNYIDRYNDNLYKWAGNIMNKATGCDVAISNLGGMRASVNAGSFDFNKMYALNPFDNHLIICEVAGKTIKSFMSKNSSYEFCITTSGTYNDLDDNTTYSLVITDYVYFGAFSNYKPSYYTDSNLILRDLMIEDLRLRKGETFNIDTDFEARITQKLER